MTMNSPVRTRIAPSPTGFLHLGTARTALYSWAFARHHAADGGKFVLRIEDTDVARSTQDSVDQILASMKWLGLEYDEGPIYQMQRLTRYQAVIDQLIANGQAYRCYSTPTELDLVREAKKARNEKPLYDNRWRPEAGKVLPAVPCGADGLPIPFVVRFKNPSEGDVTWMDLVKGEITINNREIDDLIIQRTDGIPTYNFAVVVDDWDMQISHVFRGDEHINNTPWQINIFNALGAPLPQFGHCPVILGDDGQKLSKRRGAVSVTAYEANGYLPEAMLNYLARLGWSHGDEELFTSEQMVSWFDGTHLSKSPAQWDPAKLLWVNAQYMKQADNARLARLVEAQLATAPRDEATAARPSAMTVSADARLEAICGLFKDRCETTVALADWARVFFAEPDRRCDSYQAEYAQHVTQAARPALQMLAAKLNSLASDAWDKASIAAAIKATLADTGLKMPQLAMPVRVLVAGKAQTPAVDAMLSLFDKEIVLGRLQSL
jgi:glutamyl-tRNA synthetase